MDKWHPGEHLGCICENCHNHGSNFPLKDECSCLSASERKTEKTVSLTFEVLMVDSVEPAGVAPRQSWDTREAVPHGIRRERNSWKVTTAARICGFVQMPGRGGEGKGGEGRGAGAGLSPPSPVLSPPLLPSPPPPRLSLWIQNRSLFPLPRRRCLYLDTVHIAQAGVRKEWAGKDCSSS